LNKYLSKLGFPTDKYQLVDVYGLEGDSLSFLPQPVKALIFLFPITENGEAFRKKEDADLSAASTKIPDGVFYMKQYVQNSCGTMALLHAVFNLDDVTLADGSVLKKFHDSAKPLSPEERGKLLAEDKALIEVHQELANEGQTEVPRADDEIKYHYNAILSINNELYELDGRKNYPISHGTTKSDTFLSDAARVCKEFMARDPNEAGFTIMALANAQ
jgi:ubiquitin carboxyl-terminal hydrolase L3